MTKSLFRSVCTLAALLAAPFAYSQTITTADVVGTVSDSSGAVVPNAKVTLRFIDTQETRIETTGGAGQFRFSLLHPGNYTIAAEAPGLKSDIERFALQLGQESAMNLTVKPQTTQEVIEVIAASAVLQTENANSTTSFNQAQIVDLPMSGADLTTLANTVPGVRVNVKGGSGNINANGVPGASFLFTLNGFDVMDPYNNLNNSGASNNTLGAGEVAEVAVVLNAYSAQYGRMAGGQENMISKSGSNSFHGALTYNYNDAILNANSFIKNYGGTPRGRADANQYSGNVGGPVIKNKLFFFFDTEGLRYALPGSTNVSIPSPQFQQYTLAHIPAASIPLYQQVFAVYNGAPGLNRAVPVTTGNGVTQDPSGTLGCAGRGTFAGTPFTSTQTFGVNVSCADAFVSANNSLNTEAFYVGNADWNINDKQKVAFRYQYDVGVQATSTSPFNPAFSSISHQPSDNGQLNYTYIISPTLVNSFIGGGSWYTAIFGVPSFSASQALLPERFTFNDGGAQQGGFTSVGAALPNGRNVGQMELIDDLSWTKGKHALRFGVNYRFNKVTATNLSANTINGNYTIDDLTDFATGQLNSTGKGSNFAQSFAQLAAAHIRAYSANLYAQDEWAVKPGLKITYGLRWERDGNPKCLDLCFDRMNTEFGLAGYQGGANIPYNQTIETGLQYAYAGLESGIWEPRVGFVWSPFGTNGTKKTVIRGGVGLFANLFAVSVANNIDTNSPSYFSPTVTFGTIGLRSDPTTSVAAAYGAYTALEAGFKAGYTLGQIQQSLAPIAFSAPSFYSTPNNFVAPKIWEWSFEIEQPISARNVLAITYSGSHGYDEQLTNDDANLSISTKNYPNGFEGLPTVAPDPRFLYVQQILTSGYSNYDGLTTSIRHAMSYGFQAQGSWTWSHALGVVGSGTTGTGAIYNPNSIAAAYGPLTFDTRHMVSGDLLWSAPSKYGSRILNNVLGGWSIGGKIYAYTGNPFSVTNTTLPANINSSVPSTDQNTYLADLLTPSAQGTSCGSTNIATANGTPCLFGPASTAVVNGSRPSEFAVTTAKAGSGQVAQLDYGNTGPNEFRGAGYFDIDAQITKNFTVREKYKFGFGAQFYNILNHANFANPSGTVTSSGLGLATTTVAQPSSIYGTGQGAAVSGRLAVLVGTFRF
jgi:hypothetical protein